jgi:uncharacterized membrane-anchored protein YhcB (DUF1043 family)
MELTLGWMIATGMAGLLLGTLIGRRFSSSRSERDEIERLTAELARTESEFESYRGEVYAEFAETARKFKTLDDAYAGLHGQLASSAVALCGAEASVGLLEAPGRAGLPDEQSGREALAGEVLNRSEAASGPGVDTAGEGGTPSAEPVPGGEPATASTVTESERPVQDPIVVGEPDAVPVLSDVVADTTTDTQPTRRTG